ncbi:MAG: prolyl oligopeptidase family serine peptidase [Lachnospiraceae bacterium]|nr:prolyl oligopeptidase family serine peptidase [Lachnospiraceae bacterium]
MKKKNARFWVVIALVICLISSVGASIVQTDGGTITYHDITVVTDSGHELDALLLVPDTATVDNPAPAIVVSHGWYNNREMQDLNYVEYARRGYVVISISMYGHGDSEALENGVWWDDENNANGMYDAVKYLSRLPYVDASRIGITGHSNGGLASRQAMLQDYDGLIAAALIVSNDADYYDEDGNFSNLYGSRDVGIVACQYDEFFHRVTLEDGSKTAPRDYMNQVTAQSFLYFGEDPTGLETRNSGTVYTEEIDGEEAMRVIYNPAITHPWAHFSKTVVSYSVDFFDQALGAPTQLANTDQIWQFKAFFNALGVFGFFMFAVFCAIALTDTAYFAELKADGTVEPLPAPTGKGKAWYWGGLAAGAIFGIIAYPLLYTWCNNNRPDFLNQFPSFYIGMWTLLCGLFTILMLVLSYNLNGKKNGLDLAERGIVMNKKKAWKTIVLSLTVVVATYAIVFLSDYLFLTDYRLWCFTTIRAFAPQHFVTIAKYLIFWLVYYIALSVATNGFNFVKLGKNNWLSTIVQMFFVFIGPEIMIGVQYITFFNTGYMWTETAGVGGSIIGIWLYPIVFILPVAALVCNLIYRKTKNPYIGGIIMGVIVCTITVTNTLTLG